MEITEKEQVTRAEAAARLRALATALAKKGEVEYERGDLSFSIDVPDKVDCKIEIETDGDEWELEVELKWGTKTAPPKRPGQEAQPREEARSGQEGSSRSTAGRRDQRLSLGLDAGGHRVEVVDDRRGRRRARS